MRVADAVRGAIGYFSIFPGGRATERLDRGILLAWPLIGALIGLLAGTLRFAATFVLPAPVPAILAFATLLVASGALHFDGFLDCCDGLFASLPPPRRREILHDPRCGAFAITGAAIIVPWWIAAIALIPAAQSPWLLACGGISARAAALAATFAARYGGTSAVPVQPVPVAGVAGWIVAACGATAAFFVTVYGPAGWIAAAIPAAVSIAAFVCAGWAARRLGGVLTGDVYGALCVASEVAFLTLCLVRPHWPH